MFEQMLHNLLLGILRTAPEVRGAADIEARNPVGVDHDLTLGKSQPQCAHEAKTLRGMSRAHFHRLRDGITGTKHRSNHLLSRHIHRGRLPRRNRLERHRLLVHDSADLLASPVRVQKLPRFDRPQGLEVGRLAPGRELLQRIGLA